MDQLTSNSRGVAVYLDDLLVSGANAREHLQNLQALLQCLQDKGLQWNLEVLLRPVVSGISGSYTVT